jgi:predicted RNA-binding Zn-ribbon protein involved in translation (DUF1610 family)
MVASGGQRERVMQTAQLVQLACVKCFAPMDRVETVAVLQSLEGQAVFECEWCGHVTLVRMQEPLRSACWLGSMPAGCKVSFAAL